MKKYLYVFLLQCFFLSLFSNTNNIEGKLSNAPTTASVIKNGETHLSKDSTDEDGHIKFMGLSLGGDMENLKINLINSKGLTPIGESHYSGCESFDLKGDFWKFKECQIVIKQHDGFDSVTEVMVRKDYPSLYINLLKEIINKYDEKYGAHKYEKKSLIDFYTWDFDNGRIQLLVDYEVINFFGISYIDISLAHTLRCQENIEIQKLDSDL